MVYHASPYRHRAAGQSPAGQPPPDQSAGQWMAIRQATRQATHRQASGWPSARPATRQASHPAGHPQGAALLYAMRAAGYPAVPRPSAGDPPPPDQSAGQWMAIRQATRQASRRQASGWPSARPATWQATHRQATRKGWPYYTRCVPLVERSYIVGPPLAGGLATGLSSGDQPSTGLSSGDQPSTGLSSGDQPSTGLSSGDQPSTGLSSGDQPSAGPPGRPARAGPASRWAA